MPCYFSVFFRAKRLKQNYKESAYKIIYWVTRNLKLLSPNSQVSVLTVVQNGKIQIFDTNIFDMYKA